MMRIIAVLAAAGQALKVVPDMSMLQRIEAAEAKIDKEGKAMKPLLGAQPVAAVEKKVAKAVEPKPVTPVSAVEPKAKLTPLSEIEKQLENPVKDVSHDTKKVAKGAEHAVGAVAGGAAHAGKAVVGGAANAVGAVGKGGVKAVGAVAGGVGKAGGAVVGAAGKGVKTVEHKVLHHVLIATCIAVVVGLGGYAYFKSRG